MATKRTPVVFVHGLWLHANSWEAWVDRFREEGYEPSAPGWPGDAATVEETRANPEAIAGHGIDDVVDHYAKAIADLGAKPIVIGHSFGGLIVQRLLGDDLAAAGVAIDAAPIKGVLYLPPSALRVASVALRNPGNKDRAVSLTQAQFRYGFGNTLSETESNELFERWAIPSPGKPLFEDASANFSSHSPARVNTGNTTRGPLLLVAGGKDHTVPAAITRSTLKQYRHSGAVTDFKEFSDRGHTLALDSRWSEIADYVLSWLKKHSL
jgi:pimeloyl-ACP methyl ester carboxylesterase